MPRRRPDSGWKPPLTCHKASGRARVRVNGVDHYCGPCSFDASGRPVFPPESLRAYDRVIVEWTRTRGRMRPAAGPTVAELLVAFMGHAEDYYVKNGEYTSEVYTFRQVARVLRQEYAELPAVDLGPVELANLREAFLQRINPLTGKRWTRGHVNDQLSRVRRIWKWAAGEGLVPVTVHQALRLVPGLRKGKTPAPEGRKVVPVPWETVERTLPWMPPVVQVLVRVHRLTGARVEEVCSMRPGDLTRLPDPESATGEMWLFRPASYKTEATDDRELGQHYWLAATGQRLLQPLLDCCGSPADPVFPCRTGRAHSMESYNRAIAAARAWHALSRPHEPPIPHWTPGQIRHLRLNEVRLAEYRAGRRGDEAAQAVGGHDSPRTTLIYAEQSDLARRVMRDMG